LLGFSSLSFFQVAISQTARGNLKCKTREKQLFFILSETKVCFEFSDFHWWAMHKK
jgi:hypothetical protein